MQPSRLALGYHERKDSVQVVLIVTDRIVYEEGEYDMAKGTHDQNWA
jgi:hypothetical protein